MIRTVAALVSLCSLLVLVGCNPPGPHQDVLKTAPVSGTVTLNGQPVEDFEVVFHPDSGERPATGKTDAQGKFVLGTNAVGDGAVIGTHKVSVAFAPEVDTVNFSPGAAPAPKPKVDVPKKYSSPATSGLTQEVPAGGLTDIKIELE